MITTEECEARVWNDAKLMAECLNDNEFADWLVSSIGPMDGDDLEFGQRVRGYIEQCVEAFAEAMAREENIEAAEAYSDEEMESLLMDRDNARAINAGRY